MSDVSRATVLPEDDLRGLKVARERLCASPARRMLILRAKHAEPDRAYLIVDGDPIAPWLEW